jgi:hypothetical protein
MKAAVAARVRSLVQTRPDGLLAKRAVRLRAKSKSPAAELQGWRSLRCRVCARVVEREPSTTFALARSPETTLRLRSERAHMRSL